MIEEQHNAAIRGGDSFHESFKFSKFTPTAYTRGHPQPNPRTKKNHHYQIASHHQEQNFPIAW
jgi:hypothetical protein